MILSVFFFGLVTTATASTSAVQPFRIDLAKGIPHLELLVNNTRLPKNALYPGAGSEFGVQLDFLRDLKSQWVGGYNWTEQEAELNQFAQYTTIIEGQTVHFVHEKSENKDAIPLLLLHGWPGSFQEFLPVIKPLTQSWTSPTGENVSYNVIVPSLPGFLFSSPPPQNWTNADTARLFNTLITDVLGYPTYALHGTDWGAGVGYDLYKSYNATVRAAHFAFLPFSPPTPQDIADNNITLSEIAKVTLQRTVDWTTTGDSYFTEQTFKPNDIGLALYDNPVGQLAWIGGLIKLWSDPRAGTGPSALTHTAILTATSLYYLTESFQSAVWIYAQNAGAFADVYTKPATDAPMFFSLFEYNILLWPREYVAKVGNLVSYKEHDFGGHFAGIDNPPALIEDLREMGVYLK
ncbi:Alpha/Beta hydrolase protein [Mycena rosella]|uniref:Alpha/Beta hydrolase protein n=1 Tax=Mycena rosella TaxID=1033263 RepID=A0AAD7D1M8_MYCRO|nr:Alpha/Beta hydrolase protein [Mycena rosella]